MGPRGVVLQAPLALIGDARRRNCSRRMTLQRYLRTFDRCQEPATIKRRSFLRRSIALMNPGVHQVASPRLDRSGKTNRRVASTEHEGEISSVEEISSCEMLMASSSKSPPVVNMPTIIRLTRSTTTLPTGIVRRAGSGFCVSLIAVAIFFMHLPIDPSWVTTARAFNLRPANSHSSQHPSMRRD